MLLNTWHPTAQALEVYKASLPIEVEQTKSVKVVFLDGKITTTTTPVAAPPHPPPPTTTAILQEDIHPIFQSR